MRWVSWARLAAAGAVATAGCRAVETPVPESVARAFDPAVSARPMAAGRPPAPPPAVQPVAGIEPAPAAETIDLATALRLAGVENPTVNLAREQVREAEAAHLAARAAVLPNLTAGGNVRLHRGAYQASPGFIRDVGVQSLYLGAGAGVVGTGSPVTPGVWLSARLGDAVYERLAAAQRVTARRSDAAAVENATLLDVAAAYLELAGAEARLVVLRRGEAEVAEVVRLTAEYARAGQGRRPDADRAAATADLVRRDTHRAEEDAAVAAARLCRLLSLDPVVTLHTDGGPPGPVRLVPEDTPVEALVAAAEQARPELVARSAAIQEAQTRGRQERVRPWLPTVSAGFSAGGFGGGGGQAPSDFGPFAGRTDFDVIAVWNAQNLGLGNRARVRGADAAVGSAVAAYDAALNQVRREVAEALADARAAARQLEAARLALSAAEEGFRLEADRIRQGQGLPIETLDSFRQLLDARQDVIRAAVAHDVAQFRLYAAVGAGGAIPAPP